MLNITFPENGSKITSQLLFPKEVLQLESGNIHILMGPNGSGKSTLLKSILHPNNSHTNIEFDSQNISHTRPSTRAKVFSFLSSTTGHRPNITVEDFLNISPIKNSYSNTELSSKILSTLGISPLLKSYINELSEGEYKKLFLASCLIQDVPWYLMDEPEEHLDPKCLKDLASLFIQMKNNGKSFLIACHNLYLANMLGDNFIGVRNGKVTFQLRKTDSNLHSSLENLFSCELTPDEKNFIL